MVLVTRSRNNHALSIMYASRNCFVLILVFGVFGTNANTLSDVAAEGRDDVLLNTILQFMQKTRSEEMYNLRNFRTSPSMQHLPFTVPRSDDRDVEPKSGIHLPVHQTRPKPIINYVPVVVKKNEKKMKIISVDTGMYIPGGMRAPGKYKSIKDCMKACSAKGNCFAGDYDPWQQTCYYHSNLTACSGMLVHSKFTHFKKIPCAAPGNVRYKLHLGASLFGGILMEGIKSISDCIKKCQAAGTGIASNPLQLYIGTNSGGQRCFGIDYDFATHQCFFHGNNVQDINQFLDGGVTADLALLCTYVNTVPSTLNPVLTPRDLVGRPSVVNLIMCPPGFGLPRPFG